MNYVLYNSYSFTIAGDWLFSLINGRRTGELGTPVLCFLGSTMPSYTIFLELLHFLNLFHLQILTTLNCHEQDSLWFFGIFISWKNRELTFHSVNRTNIIIVMVAQNFHLFRNQLWKNYMHFFPFLLNYRNVEIRDTHSLKMTR